MGSIQTAIIVLAFFCVIVTLFIIGLLIQRVRHSRAQETLRKSEERYLLALESSTDGLWDWNILSDSVFYSVRFREILGVSLEEFPGTMESFRSRLHPEDADGQYLKAKIEADVYQEQQQLFAKAIQAEGIAEAKGIQEMNNALAPHWAAKQL